jgi:type IV secretory pathway TraG/TraD family ATPase VirD4
MYYKGEARKMLQAAFMAYYFAGMDFCQIARYVVSSNFEMLIENITASGNKLAQSLVSGFEGVNEKNIAGTKQEVDKALLLFGTNEKVMRAVRRPETGSALWPGTLERKSVYVVIEDAKLDLYAPLLHLITAQTLEYLSTRPNKDNLLPANPYGISRPYPAILLCLDEFASLGKLNILSALRKLRKKNVRVMVLTQSLADLDLIYGKDERRAMLENFAYKVVLSANEHDTQRYFSDLAGEIETVRHTYTDNQDGGSESRTRHREKRIYPEEFAKLGDNLVLFHPGGVHQLRKAFYFRRW